jgi:hypothetical protein
MPTCRDIIREALRDLGAISGTREPTANEAADGMAKLQSIYSTMAHSGVFGRMNDVVVSVLPYAAKEQDRVLQTVAGTVTLPVTVTDDGAIEQRPPRDLAAISVRYLGTVTFSVYDGAIGSWVSLLGLTLDTEAPLALRMREPLTARLAMMLAGAYNLQPSPVTVMMARKLHQLANGRWDNATTPVSATYF